MALSLGSITQVKAELGLKEVVCFIGVTYIFRHKIITLKNKSIELSDNFLQGVLARLERKLADIYDLNRPDWAN